MYIHGLRSPTPKFECDLFRGAKHLTISRNSSSKSRSWLQNDISWRACHFGSLSIWIVVGVVLDLPAPSIDHTIEEDKYSLPVKWIVKLWNWVLLVCCNWFDCGSQAMTKIPRQHCQSEYCVEVPWHLSQFDAFAGTYVMHFEAHYTYGRPRVRKSRM